jgi:hypothetical protein
MAWRTSPWRARAWWPCLLVLFTCPACSKDGLNPVRGKVLQKGSPVPGATVFFHPKDGDIKSLRPSGQTGDDGSFTLTTGVKNGAPAGEYAVTVVWPGEPKEGPKKKMSTEAPEVERPDRLSGRYADPKTSGLAATVKTGKNELAPFELK